MMMMANMSEDKQCKRVCLNLFTFQTIFVPAFKLIHVLSLQASSDPTSDIGIVSFSSSIYRVLSGLPHTPVTSLVKYPPGCKLAVVSY